MDAGKFLPRGFFKKLGISFNKCHTAESIQRRTIQLNTNYDKKSDLNKQLNVLDKVLQKLKRNLLISFEIIFSAGVFEIITFF